MQGGMVAIVVDNVDPEDRFRVRVSYPWLADQYAKDTTSDGSESQVQSFWARIATLGTGNAEFGSFWLPEVDDEVMVIFEEGDFERPVVVGSLWNGKDKSPRKIKFSPEHKEDNVPNKQQGGQNNYRMLRSRMSHQLAFIDKEGQGAISVRTAKTAELYMDDTDGAEKIQLYDKDQQQWLEIDVANKKITLQTNTGDILIKAKESITLDCKDLVLKTSKTMDMSAGTSISQNAGTTYKNHSGSGSNITSGANIDVKGSVINLN
jgi:uncharacterized protein involved in type VI secretion and phage assembly